MILSFALKAEVKLPKLVSNGLVLQRNEPIRIWGRAQAGEKIKVTFKNKIYNAKTSKSGKWLIKLDAQEAGGPFEMNINNVVIKDVLIGYAWADAPEAANLYNKEGLSAPSFKSN